MKKLLALALLAVASVSLTACESTGNGYVDNQAPYGDERTAGAGKGGDVRSADAVFEKKVQK